MEKLIVLALFIGLQFQCYAQNYKDNTNEISTYISERPKFVNGGDTGLVSFIKKNLIYPLDAKEKGITGIVIVAFFVETDGCLTHIRVVSGRGLSPTLDQAAINVLAISPEWIPGSTNGRYERMRLTTRIRFE